MAHGTIIYHSAAADDAVPPAGHAPLVLHYHYARRESPDPLETLSAIDPRETSVAGALEALLFAAGDPLTEEQLRELLDLDEEELQRGLRDLADALSDGKRGLELRRLEDGITLSTRPLYHEVLKGLFRDPRPPKLSNAAYEVLAVIAYNQPVTRAQIEQVRGVSSDGPLARLVEQGLVEEAGRLELPGRPALFRTTETFLRLCGLESARDLPPEELLMYDSLRNLEDKLRALEEGAEPES